MPVRTNREYRAMSVMQTVAGTERRFDTDYYVEGFATTFNDPYILFSSGGVDYKEIVDRHALDNADMSDVIMQYDHQGRVYARNRMGKGKQSTLDLELQDSGFFIAADLGSTSESKKMYEDINAGLVDQMSWAFIVEKDSYDDKEHTRIIERVSKVFDVSAVSIPANPGTKIDSRSWLGGVAERERLELIAQAEKRRKLIFYLKINGGY